MSLENPNVFISILNWNNFHPTIACIQSVLDQSYANFTIVIIDNASSDNSIEELKSAFPNLEIIQLSENKGYAAAHKLSSQMAIARNYDFLWILNNDLIVEPSSLQMLLDAYKRNGIAVYGSISLELVDKDTINFAGGWELSERNGLIYSQLYNQWQNKSFASNQNNISERKVSDVNGCSMLIPIEIIKKHGFISEDFFLYKEETDYCFSLLEKGIFSIIVPSSKVFHASGGSFFNPKLQYLKTYYSERNLVLFMKRHTGYFAPYRNPFKKYRPLVESAYKIILKILTNNTNSTEFYKQLGIFHGMLGIKGKYFKPEKYLITNPKT